MRSEEQQARRGVVKWARVCTNAPLLSRLSLVNDRVGSRSCFRPSIRLSFSFFSHAPDFSIPVYDAYNILSCARAPLSSHEVSVAPRITENSLKKYLCYIRQLSNNYKLPDPPLEE